LEFLKGCDYLEGQKAEVNIKWISKNEKKDRVEWIHVVQGEYH
jgi:hypothetical protein